MEADGINRSMKYKERSMMMMTETSKPKRPKTTACKPKRLKTTVCEPKRLKTTAEKPERPKTTAEDSVEEESITVAKSLSKVVIQSFRYTWKPIVKDKLPPLSQLLSASANNTPTQSLLLNKAGQKVAFEDTLKDKFVLVYFWCLPPREEGPPYNLDYIKNEISKVEGVHDYRPFAFVLVALGNEKLFEQMFSRMPSYAIALKEDEKARKFLMETLGFEDNESGSRGLFFDENGLLVSDDATINMSAYGPFAFPFSKSRISSFMQECKELRKQIFLAKQIPPLSKLIGEHIIFMRTGEKVPTSEIESTKIVGLYFFAPNINGLVHTQKLSSVWNSLKPDDRDNFAVVVVNQHPCHLSSAMKCFRNDFGDQVPWYQVQVSGEKPCLIFGQGGMYDYCRKTREEGKLIILKRDRYQPVSYFALNILVKYGAGAYPFTMEAAMENSKKQKNIPVLSEELMCQYHWDFERLLKTVDDDIPFTADSDLESD